MTYSVYDETTTPGLFSIFFSCKILGGTWGYGTCQPFIPVPFSDADIASRITAFWNSNYACGNGKLISVVEDTGFVAGNIENIDLTPGNSTWSCKSGSQGNGYSVLARRIIVNRCDSSIFVHSVCKTTIGVTNLTLALALAPNQTPPEPRPAGTGGKSTLDLIARVTEGSAPKAGVAVTFAVEVAPNSGGHEHHDINRPNAKLSAVQGTTDANGEVKLIFTAPEVSGIHTVKATCATCSNSPAAKEIKVKVPDLIQIPADTQTPPRYVFVGQTSKHTKNHFVTEAGLDALNQVIRVFARLGWGQVAILFV